MDKVEDFDRRIWSLYKNTSLNPDEARRAEFSAMVSVFLGEGFPQEKIAQVEELQEQLYRRRALLCQKYESGELGPEAYVEAVNALVQAIFSNCEEVLGPMDFQRLFGDSPFAATGLVDPEIFLRESQSRACSKPEDSTGVYTIYRGIFSDALCAEPIFSWDAAAAGSDYAAQRMVLSFVDPQSSVTLQVA